MCKSRREPSVALADPLGGGAGRQVHAQLAAAQPAVEDVLGVLFRLDDGVQQPFAVVEVFADAPLLHADDLDDLVLDAALLDLGDVNVAAAGRLGPVRQRADHPADVDVLQVAEFADEIEDEPAALLVAQPPQPGVVGLLGQLEDRIEDQLALLDPSARQPFDLHEELGTEAQQRLFGDRLLVLADQRGVHPVPPFQVVEVVVAELGRDGVAELLPQALRRRPASAGAVEGGEIAGGEIGLREALARHEEGDFRVGRGG